MNALFKLLHFFQKGFSLFRHRLRTQDLRPTLIWLYGRGIPLITGIPIMKYSQITPEIYVGPSYRAVGKRRLEQFGISGSVNLQFEFDDRLHGLALKDYCYLPVINNCAPTIEQLTAGVTFIQQVLAAGGKVYIHCQGGISRAPTMAAAYFIIQGFTLNEAIRLIQRVRPFIDIKPVQLEQLERFDAMRQ